MTRKAKKTPPKSAAGDQAAASKPKTPPLPAEHKTEPKKALPFTAEHIASYVPPDDKKAAKRAAENRAIAGTVVLVILAALWLTYCSALVFPVIPS